MDVMNFNGVIDFMSETHLYYNWGWGRGWVGRGNDDEIAGVSLPGRNECDWSG